MEHIGHSTTEQSVALGMECLQRTGRQVHYNGSFINAMQPQSFGCTVHNANLRVVGSDLLTPETKGSEYL